MLASFLAIAEGRTCSFVHIRFLSPPTYFHRYIIYLRWREILRKERWIDDRNDISVLMLLRNDGCCRGKKLSCKKKSSRLNWNSGRGNSRKKYITSVYKKCSHLIRRHLRKDIIKIKFPSLKLISSTDCWGVGHYYWSICWYVDNSGDTRDRIDKWLTLTKQKFKG